MAPIKAGDVLLYRPSGLFGRFIQFHTGHRISHVEVYLGDGTSSASRDGQGVNLYPVRLEGLAYILRPKYEFDSAKARAFTEAHKGTPYGWFDLLNFFGYRVNAKGIVCSPWATLLIRDQGAPIFNDENPLLVAPFEFRTSELLSVSYSDGQLD